jgi:hypothetical protein
MAAPAEYAESSFGQRMKGHPRRAPKSPRPPRGVIERWYRAQRVVKSRPDGPWVYVSFVGLLKWEAADGTTVWTERF